MKSRPNGATDVTEYFVMRDSTTHAPKTDVTITDIDIYYQEQGAAQSAKADLTALAAANSAHADNKGYHCGNAVYRIDWPDAAFDGGAGKSVILIVVCTGCDTIYREIQLSPPVDIIAISGDSTAADNLEAAADGTGYNLGGGDIVAASVTAGVTASTVSDKTGYALTAAYDAAKNAAPESGGNIAAIRTKTDNLPASPAAVGSQMDLVNAPNATAVTAIQSGLATAAALDAVDNFVDTEVGAIKAVTDKLDTALELDGAVYRYTTNALEQASGTGATAQQVWEYDTRSLTDKAGFGLADDAITAAKYDQSTAYPLASSDGSDLTACATAAGFSTHSAADVKTAIEAAGSHLTLVKAVTDKVDTALELDGAVYRYTTNALEQAPSGGLDAAGVRTALGMAAANLDDQLDALPTAAENADATWDEALSEHTNVGSAGAGLSAAGSAGDPWSTAIPGSYAAGTAGQIVGDNVDGLAALIGSGGITVVSPVSEDGGTITIVQGDDYNNSDGRALEWFSDDWPDITGASITLHIEDSGGTYSEAGSVVTGGSGTQTVRVELPSADTATLDAGFQKFHLEAVLTSGRVVTLATGVAHVIADI